jgi:hypothetical protein
MFTKFTHLAFILCLFVAGLNAQDETRKIELGGFVSHINLTDSNGEGPVGLGGRFGYNFSKHVGLDTDIAYFPENGQGNFGETTAFVGSKAGYRGERFGIFAKARPGVVHFGGDSYRVFTNNEPTKFAVDLGGVVEYYPTKRTILRVDVGDTIIAFGDDRFPSGTPGVIYQPGTSHNLQTSVGFGYRF